MMIGRFVRDYGRICIIYVLIFALSDYILHLVRVYKELEILSKRDV